MNLHGIVSPYIGAVNPHLTVSVRISTGPGPQAADFTEVPGYATPGALTAAIAGDVMTVSAVAQGQLRPGQTIAGASVPAGVMIVAQLTGEAGEAGTYRISRSLPDVTIEAMTTALMVSAQVQPMTWRDLQQLDGLNLAGTRRKIYLHGMVDSVNRITQAGGDLIEIATGGPNDGVWLVAQVLEQFPDWVCAAITLQNGS